MCRSESFQVRCSVRLIVQNWSHGYVLLSQLSPRDVGLWYWYMCHPVNIEFETSSPISKELRAEPASGRFGRVSEPRLGIQQDAEVPAKASESSPPENQADL